MTPSTKLLGQQASKDRRPLSGRARVIIERVTPEIDGGRFPIARTAGESVTVIAEMFADGHDVLAGVVRYRATDTSRTGLPTFAEAPADTSDPAWTEVPLDPLGDDRWSATFPIQQQAWHEYTVEAWIDRFASWRNGLIAKADARQNVQSELLEGAALIEEAVRLKPDTTTDTAKTHGAKTCVVSGFSRTDEHRTDDNLLLLEFADTLRGHLPPRVRVMAAKDPDLARLMAARADRANSTTYDRVLSVRVDPVVARFSAWYEMFPRSCTPDPSRSGTFREAESHLPAIAGMGFDVLYLPPIHPIGHAHRKGPNNALHAGPGDPGSPWAIGSAEGGHTAVAPGLGTLDDFDRFVRLANRLGLEVALDIALQASPDHPWVREHPEWFRHRPDGSIKYAENPPKKYQDIYPLNFETEAWESLWAALRDVFRFWRRHGVRIFRVDNPHTKSFRFWEWVIAEIVEEHPDTVFLSEAFTRPRVMHYLAKAGFTQSYTHFTWKNSAHDLRDYLTALTRTEPREYFRPNFFTNTPDILHEYLQRGGRAAFEVRLILAATLSASYGIYSGYELCEHEPVREGSEEYLDSEKYQIKPRDWNRPGHIQELIARVNELRHAYPALQHNTTLAFHATDTPALLFYSKADPTGDTPRVFVVANTDPSWQQAGWVQMPIWQMGMSPRDAYVVEDLLDGARYTWRGEWNYVKLDPPERVAHIFVVRS